MRGGEGTNVEPAPDDPRSFLEGPFEIPALPGAVTRLLELPDAARSSAADAAGIVSADAALAGLLLKMVNSVYHELPTRITSVKHAVAYLGLDEIRRTVLAVAVIDRLRPEDTREFRRILYHSFHTALGARFIARKAFPGVEPEEIRFAALLHDIGKLAYLRFFPEPFRELNEYRKKRAVMMTDAETRLQHPPHTLIGAKLCERWSLSSRVKRACTSHELHDLQRVLQGDLPDDESRIFCVANLLSNLCTEELTDGLKATIHHGASRALDFSDEEFLVLMGELYDLRPDVWKFVQKL
jgi:putative nucleotidyltransferase with HDIG domain